MIDPNLAHYKKHAFCKLFFHFPPDEGCRFNRNVGTSLKHCTYFYTILTRVMFLFLNMYLSPGYRTIFKKDTIQIMQLRRMMGCI